MPGMHLRQPEFTHNNCEPFTKNKKKIQTFIETGDSRYVYQNKLDKVYFQHVITYGIFKEFPGRTVSYKLSRALALALNALAFNIAENPKYGGYKHGLATMIYSFLIESLQVELLRMPGQIL